MALEKFTFETGDGEKISVPFFQDTFTRKDMKKLNKTVKDTEGDEADEEEAIISAASKKNGYPKDFADKLDDLTMRDYKSFFEGWAEAGDTSLGES